MKWFLGFIVFLGLIAGAYWRDREMHREIDRLTRMVDRVRAELADANALAPKAAQLELLAVKLDAQNAQLTTLVAKAEQTAPPTLATLRARKPTLDLAALEAARKDADATGRLPSLMLLSQHEVIDRFGPPTVVLARDGTVTWIYKLDAFDRMIRLEFVDGVALNAYDR